MDSGTYYYRRTDGTRFPIALTVAPIYLHNQIVGAISVFRDITREKEIDRAKSELVSLASHQLRTPLTTMKWYFDMLLAGEAGPLNKQQQEYMSEIYHSNQRMVELVNALLNVSRIDLGTFSIKPTPTDMPSLVEDVLGSVRPQLQAKQIQVEPQIDSAVARLNVDPGLMKIILQNLISNSIKYSPPNTPIQVKILPQDQDIKLVVSDKGYGIPPAQQNRIFTKLFRADNAKTIDPDGNGLGLYIVKSIVEEAGGRIWFTSEVNRGTTFYIAFPVSGMAARKSEKI